MNVRRLYSEDGYAYFVKSHVDIESFRDAVAADAGDDDPILEKAPVHCWKRWVPVPGEKSRLLLDAEIGARAAHIALFTEYQDNAGIHFLQPDAYPTSVISKFAKVG